MADSDELVYDVYFECEEASMDSESVTDKYEHSELDWSSDAIATSNTSNMNNSLTPFTGRTAISMPCPKSWLTRYT